MKKGMILVVFVILFYAAMSLAQDNYYLITFTGPIMPEWKSQLSDKGVAFSSYVPDYSFIVKNMDPSLKNEIKEFNFVSSITPYNPGSKYDSSLSNKKLFQHKAYFNVLSYNDAKAEEVINQIYNLNAEILFASENKVKVYALYSQLDSISEIQGVSWIEEAPKYEISNDVASVIISANSSWENYNLSALNQTVAISDSGLDTGYDNNISEDFKGKVTLFNWYGSSADDTNGHGTHTTGSEAGSGNNSEGQFKGMAYNAAIVFQAIGDDAGTNNVYPPDNLSDLFIEAYDNGARVHSNSWGSTSNLGDYTSDSKTIDDFMWNYTDFLVVFSAGNKGSGLNTVEFPSTSKNGLSIGATENYRVDKGGNADNIDELASFSSRGPTDDGRIKPDLAAPGTYIVSAKSSLGVSSCTELYGSNGNYSYCSGTSMAAPIAAGAAALVREYYTNLGFNPSAALVKATLINGAMDIGYGIPSNETGWGRINLSESLSPPKPRVTNYTEYTQGLSTGESISFYYNVYNDSFPLKITVVWTDYPGDTSANKALVNDINLIVTSPDGSVFNGNDHIEQFNDEVDDTNNVEQVNISNTSLGSYTINISGFNIPNGPQPFALVISGPIKRFVNLLTQNGSAFQLENVTLNFSMEDYELANCSLFLDNSLNQTQEIEKGDSSFGVNLSQGVYNWYVQCAGDTFNIESDTFSFAVDFSPSITIVSPENITYSNTLIDFNFSILNFESCWYSLGSENISINQCSNITLEVNESSYSLYVYANNSYGYENFSNVEFRTDLIQPSLSLISPADGSTWTSSDNVTFEFNVSDVEISNCSLLINEEVVANNESQDIGQESLVYTFQNGAYNWSVSCSDMASNINTSETYSITVSYTPTQQSSSSGSSNGGGGGGGSSRSICEESWSCSAWSECNNNVRKRVCTDSNDCGTANKKPKLSEVCASPYTLSNQNEKIEEKEALKSSTATEKPEIIQQPVQRPRYVLNKLYFYVPFTITFCLIFMYALYERISSRKRLKK